MRAGNNNATPAMRPGSDYRADIDGLRAIAVGGVILFHAGFSWCRGGYAGVDVFFVISGYLITSIILDERARGVFTLARFYERRARRILPALLVVLAADRRRRLALPRRRRGCRSSATAWSRC